MLWEHSGPALGCSVGRSRGVADGLLCERQVQRIGPWYGVISFEDGPMVLPETTPNAPIRGDFTITLSGRNFAYQDMSPSACEQTLWLSSSWVLCKHSMGIGASRAASVITVQYSQKLGTITTAFSMDKIAMSGVSGDPSVKVQTRLSIRYTTAIVLADRMSLEVLQRTEVTRSEWLTT